MTLKKPDWVKNSEFDLKKVASWVAPKPGEDGAKILTMPNVPHPLHGLAPRTIMGKSTWDHVRKKCYFDANYKCEACGKELQNGECQAHELYTYDYLHGTAKFERCVCLCKTCHVRGIHSGRALTLFRKGSPIMPKSLLLEGAENLFRVLHEYNIKHPKEQPLRAYATFLDYMKYPELNYEMRQLIDRYDVKFYQENPTFMAKWSDWKLIIGDKEYPTPYKDRDEWEKVMEEKEKNGGETVVPPKTELDLEIERIIGLDN